MSTGIINGNVAGINIITASLTPTEVATITAPEQTFTVTGLKTTDTILAVLPPSDEAGVSLTYGRVSAANTLAIKFVNPTGGNVTPDAGTYRIVVASGEGVTGTATSIQR